MLKLVGSLCILAGCIGWGAGRIGEEKSRIRHLQEWIRIIRRIQNEIAYGKRTLPEICLLLSESCPEPYRECFGAIYEQAGRQEGEGLEQRKYLSACPLIRVYRRRNSRQSGSDNPWIC